MKPYNKYIRWRNKKVVMDYGATPLIPLIVSYDTYLKIDIKYMKEYLKMKNVINMGGCRYRKLGKIFDYLKAKVEAL